MTGKVWAGFLIFHVATLTVFQLATFESALPMWWRAPVGGALFVWVAMHIWRGKSERTGA